MADYLEMAMPITTQDGRATPYFEDYLYQVIQGLGGEGSSSIETTIITLTEFNSTSLLSHQIAQLQVDTEGYNAKTKSQNYTAAHNEWIEATSRAPIVLPSNPLRNHRVRVSNGDGSRIKISAGQGEKIKVRGKLENCVIINTAGNSYDFQWFGDYWRIA